jgi:hypothetical protein
MDENMRLWVKYVGGNKKKIRFWTYTMNEARVIFWRKLKKKCVSCFGENIKKRNMFLNGIKKILLVCVDLLIF